MRVGRSALDEDAIRQIEESNPEIEFDWTRILKGQGAETTAPPARERERAERPGGRRSSRAAESRPSAAADVRVGEPSPLAPEVDAEPLREVEEALVAEQLLEEDAADAPVVPPSAAQARLGSEGLARLRARYAEVMARISDRIADAARQEELKAQAERLNPDTWVTGDEVSAGLEQYESVFEVLRSAVGGHSRRRKRRGGAAPPEPSAE